VRTLQVIKAISFKEKTIGLIGKKKYYPLLIQTRTGIHTFFMTKAIDVIILDEKYRIRTLVQSLKPNRIFFWNPLYNNILECPSGTIEKLHLKNSEKLNLLFKN
jgi:uncharacterized membrane protein (UPF0127 family)